MPRRPRRSTLLDGVHAGHCPVEASFSANSAGRPRGLGVGEQLPQAALLRSARDGLQRWPTRRQRLGE